MTTTATAGAAGGTIMPILSIGLLAYALVSIVILWAHQRTRLYPLYLLKIAWVGFTLVGFLWIFAMSLSDPGPKHGGFVAEFLRNPAGPFAALAGIPAFTARHYASSPWWLPALLGLMLLWRGLRGSGETRPRGARAGAVAAAFMTASAALACAAVLLIDRGHPAPALRCTGALYTAGGCLLWWRLPAPWKRGRAGRAALGLLAAAAAVPAAACLLRFDWSHYTYAATNYAFAWKTARMGKYMLNSVMVSALAVCVTTLSASMAAYALTRFEFAGRNATLFAFIGAMAIPAELYIVPLFLMVQNWRMGWGGVELNFMDSRFGLSLIYAAAGLPFAVFLLSGFYRTLPGQLREAAAVDGAGDWRIFADVYFPLAMPGMATAAIFQFLAVWNEYQFALVFLSNEKLKTLPVGLYNLSVSQQYAANWSALFAGVTILCLPTFLIFVVLQERLVAGLTVGAVKE
jgi:ABC-type glycerol-3-phosphate transport system permease component